MIPSQAQSQSEASVSSFLSRVFLWMALGLTVSAAGSWWLNRDRARMQRAETDEAVRRFTAEGEKRLGMARAAGAASGVEFESGSLQTYLGEMAAELRRQVEWMRKSGDT